MICKKCGNKVSDTAAFCDKCGASMAEFEESLSCPVTKGIVQPKKKHPLFLALIILIVLACIGLSAYAAYRNGLFLQPNERYALLAARCVQKYLGNPDGFQLYEASVMTQDENDSSGSINVFTAYQYVTTNHETNEIYVSMAFGLVYIDKDGGCQYQDENTIRQDEFENTSDTELAETLARGTIISYHGRLANVLNNSEEVDVTSVNRLL